MRCLSLKTGSFVAIALALGALQANAQTVTCNWQDPCSGGDRDCMFDFCFCEANWGTSANWDCTGHPNGTNDEAVIAQTNAAKLCNGSSIATGDEHWLQINLSTETIKELIIKADSTGGTDALQIAFTGNLTLTVDETVKIDGVNGDVIFEIGDGAKLQTQ